MAFDVKRVLENNTIAISKSNSCYCGVVACYLY